ncbi:MAG: carboxypeptidase regulatory-like domain-containing protein [Bryobacterales bacterium]|nr:carboxypeptidase regulatory-like domain-containing protein [Bryobacterales bacterium]
MQRFVCLLILSLTCGFSAFAQTATGTIQGNVADATGASVPDVAITILNKNTGVRQTTQTNSSGNFIVPYLLPGEYTASAEKKGFDKHLTSAIRLSVQQTIDLPIVLKIGEVTTTVEVSAAGAQLATSTSAVSTVITNKAMMDLPLNGRNPFGLASLAPGVIPGGGSTPWISGGRNASSEITIDGTSVIVPENNVSIQDTGYQPIVDSIEEFAVITNSVAAEFGRTGGGVITVATRSGTNDLHGSLFEYLRNSKIDANSWGNNRNGVRKAAFQRNQFGGTIGGPVVLPKLYDGRNRTFFFFDAQSTRQRSAATSTATMPLAEWKAGDFSNLRNGNGQPILVYDPTTVVQEGPNNFTRTAFPGNRVPSSRFDPIAVNMLKYWPEPNALPTNAFTAANNFFSSGKAASNDDRFDSRLDHNVTQKFRFWARGSFSNGKSTPFNGFGNVGTSSGDGPSFNTNYNVALNNVYTISPTTILNINYGFARKVSHRDPFSQGMDLRALGFPTDVVASASTQNFEFPRIDVGGNNGVSSLGQATFTTLRIQSYGHDSRADLTKVLSKHTIKTGVEYRKLFMNFTQHGQPSGQYSFGNNWTQRVVGAAASTTQGNGFASFLLGQMASGTLSHTFAAATASDYWGLYLQDDWKVSSKLTLNIGLRWDVDLPRTERFNRLSYWDINAPSPIAGKVPGFSNLVGSMLFASPQDRRQTPTDYNNWGPRFGFAYQINQKTVFRGAYAILYSASVLQASGTSGSSGTQGFQSSTGSNISFDGGVTPVATFRNPFPSGYNLPEGPSGGPGTQLGLGIGDSFFNDYVNPIVQQWNGNLQRDFGKGFLVELGYLGSKGNHLIDGESNMSYNQLPASYFALGNQLLGSNTVANPFFGIITNPTSSLSQPRVALNQLLRPFPQYTGVNAFRKPQANSLYHSMTVSVTKRYSHGLNMQLSYTNGKLIDDASQVVTFLGAAGTKQDFYNRAAERSISAQDVSQRFVTSVNYELPFGKGRAFLNDMHRGLDVMLGGWQVNGIITFQTAIPLQISNGGNFTNLGSTGQRPNNNGQSAKKTGPIDQRLLSYFDQSVFSQAGNFTFGNTSRTSPDLRGPGTRAFDASIFKKFTIHEQVATEFRLEAFNAFNHPIWNAPGTTVNAPGSFGIITAKGGNRNLQMVLRLQF